MGWCCVRREVGHSLGVDRSNGIDPRVPFRVGLLAEQDDFMTLSSELFCHLSRVDVRPGALEQPSVPQEYAHLESSLTHRHHGVDDEVFQ